VFVILDRTVNASANTLFRDFSPPRTHPRNCVKGYITSEESRRWTLARLAVPMALSRGSGSVRQPQKYQSTPDATTDL